MSDLKEKKFGYIVNNQPCPGHFHPPYPPMPPPIPGVTMKDLIQYVNSYIDVRAKQIYEKIKEHQGGIDKQEIIDAVIAQFRDEIGNEVQRYIENHVNFEQLITQKIQQMDVLTEDSPTIQNLSTSMQSIGASVSSLNASIRNLGNSITTISGKVDALTTSMSGINSKVDVLIASASSFATKDSVSQVEAQVSALNSALSSYATNARVGEIEVEVSNIKASLSTYATNERVDQELEAKRDFYDLEYFTWKPGDSVGIKEFWVWSVDENDQDVVVHLDDHDPISQTWRNSDSQYIVTTTDNVTFQLKDVSNPSNPILLGEVQPSGKVSHEEFELHASDVYQLDAVLESTTLVTEADLARYDWDDSDYTIGG